MSECVHHWEIEVARGPMSVGRCRRCGSRREFANSVNGSVYNGKKVIHPPAAPGKPHAV